MARLLPHERIALRALAAALAICALATFALLAAHPRAEAYTFAEMLDYGAVSVSPPQILERLANMMRTDIGTRPNVIGERIKTRSEWLGLWLNRPRTAQRRSRGHLCRTALN